jgi:hypothetical protein
MGVISGPRHGANHVFCKTHPQFFLIFHSSHYSKRVSSPQMWGSLFDDFFERSESGVEKGYRQLERVCYYFFYGSRDQVAE